ncbi:MAG: hypothetical protein NVSMB55_27070 [Mycobacteriales bacterium]
MLSTFFVVSVTPVHVTAADDGAVRSLAGRQGAGGCGLAVERVHGPVGAGHRRARVAATTRRLPSAGRAGGALSLSEIG